MAFLVLDIVLACAAALFWWSGLPLATYVPGRGFRAYIVADSYCPGSGCRLTTFELTYPRFIHSELMTHRAFSRNAASSRAIPIQKMLRVVLLNPAMPVFWGANQKGMQAQQQLQGWRLQLVMRLWLFGRLFAVATTWALWKVGLHKQIANRVLEPWMWMTTIVSATEYANFFHLRYHKDAQPEFQHLAKMMYEAYTTTVPKTLAVGDWHMPYITEEDWADALWSAEDDATDLEDALSKAEKTLKCVSTGRCARVSYLNHAGHRVLDEDVAMHDRLMSASSSGNPGHWSPFEHVAQALPFPTRSGNFIGFMQYRKTFDNECTQEMPDLG